MLTTSKAKTPQEFQAELVDALRATAQLRFTAASTSRTNLERKMNEARHSELLTQASFIESIHFQEN